MWKWAPQLYLFLWCVIASWFIVLQSDDFTGILLCCILNFESRANKFLPTMVLSSLFLTVFCWVFMILQDFCNHFVLCTKWSILSSLCMADTLLLTQFLFCIFHSSLCALWRITSEMLAGFRAWIYSDVITFPVFFQFVLFLFILKCSSGTVAFWAQVNFGSRFFWGRGAVLLCSLLTFSMPTAGIAALAAPVPSLSAWFSSPSQFCYRCPSLARRKRSLVIWRNTLFQ